MKHNLITFFFLIVLVCLIFSCSSNSDIGRASEDSNSSSYNDDEEDENNDYISGCKYEDGTYSASVDYHNPETGYYATYNLDVEVEDCQVVQINFPNDGYLDQDHISYADVDEDGNATVDVEDGKNYSIHIDE